MPSLIGNYVAGNYRQQIVPFSRFGTRKVAWLKIGHYSDGGDIDMVKFNKIIDAIQTRAEIVMVGAPYQSNNWAKFMVAVFEDTMNNGVDTDAHGGHNGASLTAEGAVGFNEMSTTIQDILQDLNLGGDGVTVTRFYLAGAPNDGEDSGYYGFSNDSTYDEYATKSEFEQNSYLNPLGL